MKKMKNNYKKKKNKTKHSGAIDRCLNSKGWNCVQEQKKLYTQLLHIFQVKLTRYTRITLPVKNKRRIGDN